MDESAHEIGRSQVGGAAQGQKVLEEVLWDVQLVVALLPPAGRRTPTQKVGLSAMLGFLKTDDTIILTSSGTTDPHSKNNQWQ